MEDQMMFDAKGMGKKLERVKTADDFIKKWCVWYRSEIEMRQDLINVVRHSKVGIRLNKTDLIGI